MKCPWLGCRDAISAPRRLRNNSSSLKIDNSQLVRRRNLCLPYRKLYTSHCLLEHRSSSWQEALLCDLRSSERKSLFLQLKSQCPRVVNPSRAERRNEKKELRRKMFGCRREPLYTFQVASQFAQLGGSQKVFQFLKTAAKNVHKQFSESSVAPCLTLTTHELSATNTQIYNAAKQDLDFLPTPEGVKANLRRIVELAAFESDTFEPEAGSNSNEEGSRISKQKARKKIFRFQGSLRVRCFKLSSDARRVHKNPVRYHTESMVSEVDQGDKGAKTCQLRSRIKTAELHSGKDSEDLMDRNVSPTLFEASEIEQNGIVFDKKRDTYFGVRESLEKSIEKGMVKIEKETGKVYEMDQEISVWKVSDRYEYEKVEFFLTYDMAAACAVCKQGGKNDKNNQFCLYCKDTHKMRRQVLTLVMVEESIVLSDFANQHDMHVSTLLLLNNPAHSEFFEGFTQVPRSLSRCQEDVSSSQASTHSKQFQSRGRQSIAQEGFSVQPGQGRGRGRGSKRVGCEQPRYSGYRSTRETLRENPVVHRVDSQLYATWNHTDSSSCLIPANTVLRIVRKNKIERESLALSKNWLNYRPRTEKKLERLLICTLHADMRLSEGILLILFRKVKHESPSRIESLVSHLRDICKISNSFYRDKISNAWCMKGLNGPECKKLRDSGELHLNVSTFF